MTSPFICIIKLDSSNRSVLMDRNGYIPTIDDSPSGLIEQLIDNNETMSDDMINQNLRSILNVLLQSLKSLDHEYHESVSSSYYESIGELMKDKSDINDKLKDLLSLYYDVMKSERWAVTSKIPNNRCDFEFESLTNIDSKISMLSNKIISSGGVNIINNRLNPKIKIIDKKKQNQSKEIFNNIVASTEVSTRGIFLAKEKESLVKNMLWAFLDLQKEVAEDYNVTNYVIIILNKIIVKMSSNFKAYPKEEKIRKVITLIKSGIPTSSFSGTRECMTTLEEEFLKIFPGNSIPYEGSKEGNKTESEILALTLSSLNDDREMFTEVITKLGNNATEEELDVYNEFMANSSNTIVRLLDKNRRTRNQDILSQIGSRLGDIFKRSKLSNLASQFTEEYFESQYRDDNITSYRIENNSLLNINISQREDDDLFVSFSGNLEKNNLKGSFTINEYFLRFIAIEAFLNIRQTSGDTKTKICKTYGFSTNDDASVWKSLLVFIFTYLSLIVYCIVDKDNIFNVDMYDDDYPNLNFLFSKISLEQISTHGFNLKSKTMSNSNKFIISHGMAKTITYYMYKKIDPTSISQTTSSTFNIGSEWHR